MLDGIYHVDFSSNSSSFGDGIAVFKGAVSTVVTLATSTQEPRVRVTAHLLPSSRSNVGIHPPNPFLVP